MEAKHQKDAELALLKEAQVVLCTLAGAGTPSLDKLGGFDLAVVDEAGQATEPATWIPLLRCRRAVLVGDSQQLPPTVISREASQQVGGPCAGRPRCSVEALSRAYHLTMVQVEDGRPT